VLTSQAVAQQAVPDTLCAGLDLAVAAAAEDRPFLSLAPEGQTLGSLPAPKKNPAGFGEFKGCQIYRAGNSRDGMIGGGPHNYFRCTAVQILETLAARPWRRMRMRSWRRGLPACMTRDGWTASEAVRSRKYEDYETVVLIMHKDAQNQVAVELISDNAGPGSRASSTTWSVFLTVRKPNPKPPRPQLARLFRTGARRSSGRN